jgi:hypothetical protein
VLKFYLHHRNALQINTIPRQQLHLPLTAVLIAALVNDLALVRRLIALINIVLLDNIDPYLTLVQMLMAVLCLWIR